MKTALHLTAATLVLAVSNLSAATLYVSLESTNPTPPYTNWATAATNIQQAVDAGAAGDGVLVSNGLYTTGGRGVGTNVVVNRVAVDKPLALRSVNGPQFTVINAGGRGRCAYLTNGASLSGFTLTNGYSSGGDGAGVWCTSTNAFLTNCTLTGNSAPYGSGGGAYDCTLYNCTLTGNSAY